LTRRGSDFSVPGHPEMGQVESSDGTEMWEKAFYAQ
jgi:hypothetical protein